MSTANDNSINLNELALGAKFLHAYLECSNEIQDGIREMIAVMMDPSADRDDVAMAIHTLADALCPHLHEGRLGVDLEQSETMGAQQSEAMRQALEELDTEEAVFADRLSAIMAERGINQTKLAEMTGVGQPAISNMLVRHCRPQRRTVLRFANALGISPSELWPGFSG